jgi:hypothetical protein
MREAAGARVAQCNGGAGGMAAQRASRLQRQRSISALTVGVAGWVGGVGRLVCEHPSRGEQPGNKCGYEGSHFS